MKIKGRSVITFGPNETVAAAIQKLVDYDRGSIPVYNEKGELVGIITERDIIRKCFARIGALTSIKIRDGRPREWLWAPPRMIWTTPSVL